MRREGAPEENIEGVSAENLPRVDPSTGIFVDNQGKEWTTGSRLGKMFKRSSQAVRKLTADVEFIEGIAPQSGRVKLFPIDEIRSKLEAKSPKVDPVTGIYVDSSGNEWITIGRYCSTARHRFDDVVEYAKNLPSIRGYNDSGNEVTLYRLDELNQKFEEGANLPKIDPTTGIYTDELGNQWTSIGRLKDILQLSHRPIVKLAAGMKSMRATYGFGNIVTLYPIKEMRAKAQEITSLPQADAETGIYTDENARQWVSQQRAMEIFGITQDWAEKFKADLPSMQGRTPGGQVITMYPLAQLKEKIETVLNTLPRVDAETGIYVDNAGREWTTKGRARAILGVPIRLINETTNELSPLDGLDGAGHAAALYPLKELREKFRDLSSLPRVDSETSIYTDDGGRQWATINKIARMGKLAHQTVQEAVQNSQSIRALSEGHPVNLYSIEEAQKLIEDLHSRKETTSPTPKQRPKVVEPGVLNPGPEAFNPDGTYTDSEGNVWTASYQYGRLHHLTPSREELEGLNHILIRRYNKNVRYYLVSDLDTFYADKISKPFYEAEVGFKDNQGKEWIDARTYSKRHHIGEYRIRREAEKASLPQIAARMRGGGGRGKCILYPLAELDAIFSETIVETQDRIYTDPDGVEWVSVSKYAEGNDITYNSLEKSIRRRKLESIKGRHGQRVVYLYKKSALDEIKAARDELLKLPVADNGVYTDEDGKMWVTATAFARLKEIPFTSVAPKVAAGDFTTIQANVGQQAMSLYSFDELDAFFAGRGPYVTYTPAERPSESRNQEGHVQAETVKVTPEEFFPDGSFRDSEGQIWIKLPAFKKKHHLTPYGNYGEQIQGLPFCTVSRGGPPSRYYLETDLEQALANRVEMPFFDSRVGYVDDQGRAWTSIDAFRHNRQIGPKTMKKKIEEHGLESIEARKRGRSGTVLLYRVDQLEDIFQEYSEPVTLDETETYTDEDGTVWISVSKYASEKNVGMEMIANAHQRSSLPRIRGKLGTKILFLYKRSDLDAIHEEKQEFGQIPRAVEGFYTDPAGKTWVTINHLRSTTGRTAHYIKVVLAGFETKRWLNETGQRTDFYPYPEAKDFLEQAKDTTVDQRQYLKNEMANPDSLIYREIKEVVKLFGASSAVDILYAYHPEFRGLPPEYVKGMIGDYLGEFLLQPQGFHPDDLNPGTAELIAANPNLREGLSEVIKTSCLNYYNEHRKANDARTPGEIITEYLATVSTKTSAIHSEILDEVVSEVEMYWQETLTLPRPTNMIPSIREGREFPDINQRINIHEITTKHRMLIGDDMGLGKSASAIMTAECLRAKNEGGAFRTLIVAPSNVISTWQRYLSSQSEGGYFLDGQEPQITIIESPDQLDRIGNADYVLISQERLSDIYTEELVNADFDYLIMDEVHKLKNVREGVRSANAVKLSQSIQGEGKYVALLSGTPVPNKIEDIAVTLKMLYPEKYAEADNAQLVNSIIKGDLIDLRSLLVPRMQLKELAQSIEMPELSEGIRMIELTKAQRQIYEALLDDDELLPQEKIQILRKFLIDPTLVDLTPGIGNQKLDFLKSEIEDAFREGDKIIVFVNGYVEDVLRGEEALINDLGLPDSVEVMTIHGEVLDPQRDEIQNRFNQGQGQKVLFVSGQTADVGVDFSGASRIVFYNEPWTRYDFRQQRGRVFREGLDHPVRCHTFVIKDTIEEGIHLHALQKERAVEKLLRGIPVTELDRQLLVESETQMEESLEVSPELARFYLSSYDRIMKMFSFVKREMGTTGQAGFQEFLKNYDREYAGCYLDIGSRSYQGNAARVSARMITGFAKEAQKSPEAVRVLDIASGPEMLRKHIGEEWQPGVVSMDINRQHFREGQGARVVSSFLKMPFAEHSFDFANFSLSWHYSGFHPTKGLYERLEVLSEIGRVLKPGGKAVINNVYSIGLRSPAHFRELVGMLGLKVDEENTGDAVSGDNFRAGVIVLEKTGDPARSVEEMVADPQTRKLFDGLKFRDKEGQIKNSRRIIHGFEMNGHRMAIELNQTDQEALAEERAAIAKADELKARYDGIERIPASALIEHQFSRYRAGHRYKLMKKMEIGGGVVVAT